MAFLIILGIIPVFLLLGCDCSDSEKYALSNTDIKGYEEIRKKDAEAKLKVYEKRKAKKILQNEIDKKEYPFRFKKPKTKVIKRSQVGAFKEATELKENLLEKEKKAKTSKSWRDISSSWLRAKYFFEQIKNTHPNYNKAQEEMSFCTEKSLSALTKFKELKTLESKK